MPTSWCPAASRPRRIAPMRLSPISVAAPVGGRDDVGAGIGLGNRRPHQLVHGLVIDDLAIPENAVMAMAGEGVERHIGDHPDVRDRLLYRRRHLIEEVVALEDFRAGLVAQFHFDIRKRRQCRDPEIGGLLRSLNSLVDTHPENAGHGGDRVHDVRSWHNEDRPDEVVDRQTVLLDHPALPVGLAQAAHAPVSGNCVYQMCLVRHQPDPRLCSGC